MAEAFLTENWPEATFGAPKAGAGMWASCIRLISPIDGRTIQVDIYFINYKMGVRYHYLTQFSPA